MVVNLSPGKPLTHTPVLTEEVLRLLAVQPGGRYVDCTTGAGGHAAAVLDAAAPGGLLLGLDADPAALKVAEANLERFGDSVRLVESNFRNLASVATKHNFVPVHGIVFDLGISSLQLSDDVRGFSFQAKAPLDMRMNQDQEITAADIINTYEEAELANLIWRYGEEPASRRIARAIVRARPLDTTDQLAEIIASAAPRGRSRIHPATRTFQALRIVVNDELGALQDALGQARDILGYGSRIVVISFHSLEDRIVKQFFQQESRDCICPPETPVCVCGHIATLRILTRRPVTPTATEVAANPRSRSARLRAAERLTNGAGRAD